MKHKIVTLIFLSVFLIKPTTSNAQLEGPSAFFSALAISAFMNLNIKLSFHTYPEVSCHFTYFEAEIKFVG